MRPLLLLFLFLGCIHAKMTELESFVYMNQLIHQCTKVTFTPMRECRQLGLDAKPELLRHHGFMHRQFEDLYDWNSKIISPEDADLVRQYYDAMYKA